MRRCASGLKRILLLRYAISVLEVLKQGGYEKHNGAQGLTGSVEYSDEGSSAEDLRNDFHNGVDDYLALLKIGT